MANRNKTVNSFFWRFFERSGAEGVSFIVSVILARLLDPEVYGTVALITVFTAIIGVFQDCGFGLALVQKKDPDDLDYSTVFYFNLFSGTVLYLAMFFAAPSIASFYNRPELIALIRVMSLSFLIGAIKGVQCSYVSKHMIFKKFFFATLGGTIGAAVIGIWMAFRGYGVWALVVQGLFNNVVDTIILFATVKWRPKKMFSFERLKSLFSFGWKMFLSSLLDTVYNKLRSLIIGKKYSSEDLAFYNKGNNYPAMVVSNINSSINSVLFPSLSQEQDNPARVKAMTRRAIQTSTYLIMPMMMGLAVCAGPLIELILTEKWLPCVPYLRIFCFTYAFYPIHTANLNAIQAMGRSDYFLQLEIIKKAVGLTAIGISMWFGVMWMAYSLILTSILGQIINSWPNKKLLNYSYLEQLKDMLPQIGLSVLMGAIVYCVTFLGLNDIVTLLIQIPLGVLIYVAGSKIFHIESFDYVWNLVLDFLRKKKKKA